MATTLGKLVNNYFSFDVLPKFSETAVSPIDCWKNSLKEVEQSIQNLLMQDTVIIRMVISLKTDLILLSCVVEEIRMVCYETNILESIQNLSSPHLSGGGSLRTCKVDLCLITEREHREMVENVISGGVSSVFEKRPTT